MDESLRYLIALSFAFENNPSEARALLEHFGTAKDVFKEKSLLKIEGIKIKSINQIYDGSALRKADEEINILKRNSIKAVSIDDSDYPYRLKECNDAPIVIYSKGQSNLNSDKIVSIVGTRLCTPLGKQFTEKLVNDLAEAFPDIIVVSGLAYGIDITSQRAAVKNSLNTVAVLAHGMQEIYPAAHRKDAVKIIGNGSLITELPFGTPPEKWQFLRRNRIVAGLCDACVVVESAEKGGSLNTAYTAFGYGREVFAFPGRPSDEKSKGCNMLIKRMVANLTESSDDIISNMNWKAAKDKSTIQKELFQELTPVEQKILDSMRTGEKYNREELCAQNGLKIAEIMSVLMSLEIAGLVESIPGGSYIKNLN